MENGKEARQVEEQVEELEQVKEQEATSMARLVLLLVRVKFLPVTVRQGGRVATFRFCSGLALSSFCLYYLSTTLLFLTSFLLFNLSMTSEQSLVIRGMDVTDNLSNLGFSLFTFLILPILPLVLANSISLAPLVTLSPLLPYPRHARRVFFCELLCLVGYSLRIIPIFIHFGSEGLRSGNPLLIISAGCLLVSCLILGFCSTMGQLLVVAWLDHLGDLLEEARPYCHLRRHLQDCLGQYNSLDKALGSFYLFHFSVHQFTWIFSLYMSLTGLLAKEDQMAQLEAVHGSGGGEAMLTLSNGSKDRM